ncbi:hypothetical protein SDC9_103876 [bioreactor metagenome]|uniref:Uncharacterized protein n=1 Tax=bioreactor metagenome TaxID=1076179 RepID=A0A645AWB9_9ZZZZ
MFQILGAALHASAAQAAGQPGAPHEVGTPAHQPNSIVKYSTRDDNGQQKKQPVCGKEGGDPSAGVDQRVPCPVGGASHPPEQRTEEPVSKGIHGAIPTGAAGRPLPSGNIVIFTYTASSLTYSAFFGRSTTI